MRKVAPCLRFRHYNNHALYLFYGLKTVSNMNLLQVGKVSFYTTATGHCCGKQIQV